MEAKSTFQKQIIAIDKKLTKLTNKQKDYGYKHCLPHMATLTKGGKFNCLDCGHRWKANRTMEEKELKITCPSCKSNLEVKPTQKRTFKYESYYSVISMSKGHQVIRMCVLKGIFKVGEKPIFTTRELFRNWISSEGKVANVGYYNTSRFYDTWGGGWQLRGNNAVTSYTFGSNVIYPKFSVIKELKRNGFNGEFHKVNPLTMFTALLNDTMFETLYKAKEYKLIQYYDWDSRTMIHKYWSAIKITLRHNYKISDVSIWFDYLAMLEFFNKDLNNPKFVCPVDLYKAHDILMHRKEKIMEKRRREEAAENRKQTMKNNIEKIKKEDKKYKEDKGRFFNLHFSNGEMEISVLNSVEEFMIEGDTLNHCVFTQEYHLKEDSLILSARVCGKRIATIEVNLKNYMVLQCRGKDNLQPKEYDAILELLEENMHLIKKAALMKVEQLIAA